MFGVSKTEVLTQKEGYVIWSENLSDVKKATYLLPENVKGVIVVDGAVSDSILAGAKYEFVREKHSTSSELVLSSADPIIIRWGVGGVTYKDYEAKLDAKCGLSGEISLKVQSTKEAMKKYGKNVTAEDIRNAVFNTITMFIEGVFGDVLGEDSFGRPDLSKKKVKIVEGITKKVDDFFAQSGLLTMEVNIRNLMVDEQYEAKRQEWEDRKEEKRKIKDDLKTLQDVKDVFSDDTKKQEPKVIIKEVFKCPGCGHEVKQGERFCPVCGKKIG